MENAEQRAKKIKFILTDVDGVLTDGKLNFYAAEDGTIKEIKGFNSTDGIAFMLWCKAGFNGGIITGRVHPAITYRAKTMGMKYIYQGFINKRDPFKDVLKKTGLKAEEVAYIGDDLIDLQVITETGFACCPADALDEVKQRCHYITPSKGGEGAPRDVIEFILKAQGVWDGLIKDVIENGLSRCTEEPEVIISEDFKG